MDEVLLGDVMPNQRLERAVMAKLVGAASAEDHCALAAADDAAGAERQCAPASPMEERLRRVVKP